MHKVRVGKNQPEIKPKVDFSTKIKVRVGKNQPEIKPKVDFSTKINKKEEFICNTANPKALV